MLLLHVDDSAITGHREDIEEMLKSVREEFKIKTEGGLNNFSGCDMLREKEKMECWMLQPHLIKKLNDKFFKTVNKMRETHTAGTPRLVIDKVKDEEDGTGKERHCDHGSGVGGSLCLLKHSRPELSNPMRELSRGMSNPGNEHEKEMHGVIKWVLDNPDTGPSIGPEMERNETGDIIWRLKGMCDSTWGSNKDDGRSVTGCTSYSMVVPVLWKSKIQPHVTLSMSEARHVATNELVEKTLFVL